jgi:hypothetical protein
LACFAAAARRAAAAALDCSTLQRTQTIPVSQACRAGQRTRPDYHGLSLAGVFRKAGRAGAWKADTRPQNSGRQPRF